MTFLKLVMSARLPPNYEHTRLFITSGYHFHTIDAMITHFHIKSG
ncbi:MAG TPA: S-adenosylmethionine:tRNA ribosyltransferase-isomerase [Ktedonobacteraceae bacterium]|jgi:S-adenosylmethionine:tRNA-ribosyltransferase-isomerase (queuine synthetase)